MFIIWDEEEILTRLSRKCMVATAIKSMQFTRKRSREIRTPRRISSPLFAALWRTSSIGSEDRAGQLGTMVFRK